MFFILFLIVFLSFFERVILNRERKTKHEGVFEKKLKNGDISYIVRYQVGAKTVKKTIGKKSSGYSVQLAKQKR